MAEPFDAPSYAIIDGLLCKLSRRGTVLKKRAPMGSTIAEFMVAGQVLIVRETAEGFLPGMSNLYGVDDELKMLWLAEPPFSNDSYAGFIGLNEGVLNCRTKTGRESRVNPADGKLLN